MKYVVIDEDGQLHQRTADRYEVALRDVGPEGWDMVRCYQHQDLQGFVNDCGMLLPDRYGRNVVGSLLLASLGANIYPYCGPVLIAGWVEPADIEIVGLDEQQLDRLRTVHGHIQAIMAGRELAHLPAEWQAAVRELAEAVRSLPLPTPMWTVLTGDEALAHMRRADR